MSVALPAKGRRSARAGLPSGGLAMGLSMLWIIPTRGRIAAAERSGRWSSREPLNMY